MIAIVYYKDANLLSVISIIISMFSVASKSFVFSVAGAMDTKTLLLNWISAVSDFFGIFFVVSWVFYNTDDIDNNNNSDSFSFNFIGTFWFIKYVSCVLPIVFVGSIGGWMLGLDVLHSHYIDRNTPQCKRYIIYTFGSFVIAILWVFGCVTSSILLEIACFVYIAFFISSRLSDRYPMEKEPIKNWDELLKWVIYDASEIRLPLNMFVMDWKYLESIRHNNMYSNNNDNNREVAINTSIKRHKSSTQNYSALENKAEAVIEELETRNNEHENDVNASISVTSNCKLKDQEKESKERKEKLDDKLESLRMNEINEIELNDFRENEGSLIVSKNKDRLLRICVINRLIGFSEYLTFHSIDEVHNKYLIREARNGFKNVTFASLTYVETFVIYLAFLFFDGQNAMYIGMLDRIPKILIVHN